jgi:hypothetical protein
MRKSLFEGLLIQRLSSLIEQERISRPESDDLKSTSFRKRRQEKCRRFFGQLNAFFPVFGSFSHRSGSINQQINLRGKKENNQNQTNRKNLTNAISFSLNNEASSITPDSKKSKKSKPRHKEQETICPLRSILEQTTATPTCWFRSDAPQTDKLEKTRSKKQNKTKQN